MLYVPRKNHPVNFDINNLLILFFIVVLSV